MPTTLGDIARALNVSKMTVSRAINNHPEINAETRARVLAAARKMNYRPNQFARALTSKHSYLIGIVVPDLMHSYFAEICRGVESHARPAGYQNLICSTDEEARKRSEEHTSELQSRLHLVCRLLLEKKKKNQHETTNKLKDSTTGEPIKQSESIYHCKHTAVIGNRRLRRLTVCTAQACRASAHVSVL